MRPQAFMVLAALLIAAAIPSRAWTYQAGWRATGLYEEIVAADCSDCEEELGIIIACKGNGLPAEVTVNAAASQSGQDGAEAPVTFTIDGGEDFTRTARTVEFGMIGFTPVFSLPPDDPIVPALQSGARAFVTFNGARAKLGLKGSREALDIFKAHCGWTPAGFQQNQERAAAQAASAPPPATGAGGSQTATAKAEAIATAIYRCEGNKGIDATYYPDSVDLTLTDGRSMELPQVTSGSGARYANGDESFVFWNKGDTAFVTEGADDTMTFKDCVAIP